MSLCPGPDKRIKLSSRGGLGIRAGAATVAQTALPAVALLRKPLFALPGPENFMLLALGAVADL
jgi:hypothetical protein